jgi:hypothetical protein
MDGGAKMSRKSNAVAVDELDARAGAALFDEIARTYMGISGAEFIRRWQAGLYEHSDWDEVPGLAEVATALPFAIS